MILKNGSPVDMIFYDGTNTQEVMKYFMKEHTVQYGVRLEVFNNALRYQYKGSNPVIYKLIEPNVYLTFDYDEEHWWYPVEVKKADFDKKYVDTSEAAITSYSPAVLYTGTPGSAKYFKIWSSICRLYEGKKDPPIHNHSAMLQFAEEYKEAELKKFARFIVANIGLARLLKAEKLIMEYKEQDEG